MKGMTVYVYRACDHNVRYRSASYDRVTLIGEGIPEIFEPSLDRPAVYLLKRADGSLCASFDPVKRSPFGGAFIWSCDSRFRDISEAPIPIHDANI